MRVLFENVAATPRTNSGLHALEYTDRSSEANSGVVGIFPIDHKRPNAQHAWASKHRATRSCKIFRRCKKMIRVCIPKFQDMVFMICAKIRHIVTVFCRHRMAETHTMQDDQFDPRRRVL